MKTRLLICRWVILSILFFTFALAMNFSSTWAKSPENISQRTEWFKNHGYGVFVHYLNDLQNKKESLNSLGRETDWNQCVQEFDVEKFADQVQRTGAGYVVFTMMQQTRFLIAPNDTFNRLTGYKPGEACSTRDLVEELYQALHKRNIDLLLYWTGDGPNRDRRASAGTKTTFPVTREFVENWASVAAEYGRRYGKKVKGYWVDGSYESIGYNNELLNILANGLRDGNSDRILAFNPGVKPVIRAYADCEDFTCGEKNAFEEIPKSRFIDGKQWHTLSFLGMSSTTPYAWGRPGVALDRQALADYIYAVNVKGGVVTVDLMLYRDGSLERSQLENMRTLREKLQEKGRIAQAAREGWSVPPGNIAWKKLSRLTSLDGTRTLPPSGGNLHEARLGIDGDRKTTAVGAYDWAWRYEVDLQGKFMVNRVTVHFGTGYPTEVEVFLMNAEEKWISLGRFHDQHGESLSITITPIMATCVAVSSYKPDGINQPGTQMSVSEIEVYEQQ